jgi:putative ATP-binding cassette transporter
LREALSYPIDRPTEDHTFSDTEVRAALVGAGLSTLASNLDLTGRWDQSLSAGERQRIAIARLLLHQPDVIILDDAMTALDDAARTELLHRLREVVPEAAILNVGQSPRLLSGDGRALILERHAGGAHLGDPLSQEAKRTLAVS